MTRVVLTPAGGDLDETVSLDLWPKGSPESTMSWWGRGGADQRRTS